MTTYTGPLQDVARVIELAVAPVFLLTAIGTVLNVLSSRLARIVDRARVLLERKAEQTELKGAIETELATLHRRRNLVNLAITFGTTTALFVCILISAAFIGAMLQLDARLAVAILFVVAMFTFIVTLLLFLREILLAVAGTRMDLY